MKFLFVCGGSAGHINPALAIAEELRRKRPESGILFVGADKTLEKRLIPDAGFDLVNIRMSGLRRGLSPGDIVHNIKTAGNLFAASSKSTKLMKEYKPDAVIGTGGYICYPVLKKAAKTGIPTFVLEPNAYPGLAVRMLSDVVDKVLVTYEGTKAGYRRPERVVYTGTPLRNEFFKTENSTCIPDRMDKPLVISYWGSLGAAGMNNMITEFIKLNYGEQKFNHIHATGAGTTTEDMKVRLKDLGVSEIKPPIVDIREYIDDMPSVMRSAEIVLSRAGASTIAELTTLGKPAVLVPSPNVTENHQEENAKQLENAGGAVMIRESDCTGEILYRTIVSLLGDKDRLDSMASAQKSLSVPDAAAKTVDIVLEFCKNDNVRR